MRPNGDASAVCAIYACRPVRRVASWLLEKRNCHKTAILPFFCWGGGGRGEEDSRTASIFLGLFVTLIYQLGKF